MKDYAKTLIRKFDKDSDGIISFQELCDGIRNMNILLTQPEREALMKKIDINKDGSISAKEL
jgi:Ca2+-binding EF-hand superfamily protein